MKIWGFFICEMMKYNADFKYYFTGGLVLLYRSHVMYEIHCHPLFFISRFRTICPG